MLQFEKPTAETVVLGMMLILLIAAVPTRAQSPASPLASSPAAAASPDAASPVVTKTTVTTQQFALRVQNMGMETDKDGTYPVFKIMPPYAGWAITSLNADNAAVALTPAGLAVSWVDVHFDKDSKPMGRQKTVDVVPFDIATTTVKFTPKGTQWKDKKGHVFALNRATSPDHPVEIGF